MKKILILFTLLLTSCLDNEYSVPTCGGEKDFVMSSFTNWINNSSSSKPNGYNKSLQQIVDKNTAFKVVNASDFIEYLTSPMLLGTNLYQNYKKGRICDVKLSIELNVENYKKNFDLKSRYQLYKTDDDYEHFFININNQDFSDLNDKIREETNTFILQIKNQLITH